MIVSCEQQILKQGLCRLPMSDAMNARPAKDHRAHDAEGKLSKEYKPDADETCGFGWFFQDETCVCGKKCTLLKSMVSI